MDRLKVAIVGSGLIATLKHIPAYRRHRDKVDLCSLCDLNQDAARKVAGAHGIPRTYSDIAEMLEKEKPDIVDICTPPQTHKKVAVQAMAGRCNVLIEKPMALTQEDCDEIVKASHENGVKVCVAHSDLFYYPFMEARERVKNGEIGEFRGLRIFLSTPTDYITSKKDHWAHKLPGGIIGETGPHIVYMTLAYINPIVDVSVNGLKIMDYPWSRYEDYRIDLIGEKAISSVTLNYATDQWMARVEVLGEKGTFLVDLEAMSLLKYHRERLAPAVIARSSLSESAQIVKSLFKSGSKYATKRLRSTHDFIIGDFIESICKGTDPPVTAEEGRESVRVLKMIVDRLEARSNHVKAGG